MKMEGEPRSESVWATSGEMLYRCGYLGLLHSEEWASSLGPLEAELDLREDFALRGKKLHDKVEEELSNVHEWVKRQRESRIKALESRLRQVESQVDLALESIQLQHESLSWGKKDFLRDLDCQLLKLCSDYSACIQRECELIETRLAERHQESYQKVAEIAKVVEFEEFALRLAFETSGEISLKRLSKDNPQYIRCKRATAENIKPQFFSSSNAAFDTVSVLDIFKIENKPMLKAFQRLAATLKTGSVKGLFCSIPEESLERLIVQGMKHVSDEDEQPSSGVGDGDAIGVETLGKCFHKRIVPLYDRERGLVFDQVGIAEKKVLASKPVPFPITFSRFSTLESDRRVVELESLENETLQESSPRYLVLCRVILGEVFHTSNEYRGFPSVDRSVQSGKNKFDSMYSSSQDEYLLLNGDYVLPEFIIRFRYTSSKPASVSIHHPSVADKRRKISSFAKSSIVPSTLLLPREEGGDVDVDESREVTEKEANYTMPDVNEKAKREEIWSHIALTLMRATRQVNTK